MSIISSIARAAMFSLDPEKAHAASILALKSGLIYSKKFADPVLKQTVAGIDFANPLGLAAGYDKDGQVPLATLKLGFSFTEIGTLTPKPQAGNPKPRLFRLKSEQAVINRMGFNNGGYQAAFLRLSRIKGHSGIIGVNIGANKDSEDRVDDYVQGINKFYLLASYFTINISSPNTVGLRNLQSAEQLDSLLSKVLAERDKLKAKTMVYRPIFLKIAPDLQDHELDDIAAIILNSSLDGLIISNTTISRDNLTQDKYKNMAGGLSGVPVFEASTRVLAKMRLRLGVDIPIIACGGINSPLTALTKIKAGADLLQLYTGLIYGGPWLPNKILKGLAALVRAEGAFQIRKLRDSEVERWAYSAK